jgi:hypothetical protein
MPTFPLAPERRQLKIVPNAAPAVQIFLAAILESSWVRHEQTLQMTGKEAATDHAASDERRGVVLFEVPVAEPGKQFAATYMSDFQLDRIERFHRALGPGRFVEAVENFHTGIVRHAREFLAHVRFDVRKHQHFGRQVLREPREWRKRDGQDDETPRSHLSTHRPGRQFVLPQYMLLRRVQQGGVERGTFTILTGRA